MTQGEIGDVPALIQAVTQHYDGVDHEADRLAEGALQRLAWRRRNSGKACDRCRATKAVSSFSKDSRNPDGLRRYCRECASATYKSSRVNA